MAFGKIGQTLTAIEIFDLVRKDLDQVEREIGLELWGDIGSGLLRYEAGVFNGNADNALTDVDALTLDTLARLQLIAQRLGTSIHLLNASPKLVDLLALAGLSEVLRATAASGVEIDRLVEQREQIGVDEEIHPGDAVG